jgi:hypothetical protein
MEWPAGLVEKMSYADTVYTVLSRFAENGQNPYQEGSMQHDIILRWIEHLRKKWKGDNG